MAVKAVGGTAYLKIDGKQMPLRGNFRIKPGGVKRTPVTRQDGVVEYTEETTPGEISCDFSDTGGISYAELLAMKDVTMTCELVNGKVWMGRNGWFAGDSEIDTNQGQFPATFNSAPLEEV